MVEYVHRLSGILFYVLGSSFFVAYLLHFNNLWGLWPKWWMQVADLPLALVAMLFGGLSLYLSVTKPDEPSKRAAMIIGTPLVVLFVFVVVMNFWDVF